MIQTHKAGSGIELISCSCALLKSDTDGQRTFCELRQQSRQPTANDPQRGGDANCDLGWSAAAGRPSKVLKLERGPDNLITSGGSPRNENAIRCNPHTMSGVFFPSSLFSVSWI